MILDRLAAAAHAAWRTEKAWQAELARDGALSFCKPLTFMNLSGFAVSSVAAFYKIVPAEILLILDDTALPLGKLRLRPSGSSGGHNGLSSVIEHLGTREVARLRVGIGAASPGDGVAHVLGRFALEEKAPLEQGLARAIEAVGCAQTHGLAVAMNTYN